MIGFNTTMRYVTNSKGELVVIARSARSSLTTRMVASASATSAPYGATLNVKPDQQSIKAGISLANWGSGLTRPIITEFAPARRKFENVEGRLTVARQVDEVTGLSTMVVIDPVPRRDHGAPAASLMTPPATR